MKYSEDIKSITYMKTNSADLIKKVSTTRRPVVITQNGEAKVIVQDVLSYERDKRALQLLMIFAQGSEEALKGKAEDHDVFMGRMEKKFKSKMI